MYGHGRYYIIAISWRMGDILFAIIWHKLAKRKSVAKATRIRRHFREVTVHRALEVTGVDLKYGRSLATGLTEVIS